jgi:hypothetical protein
MSSQVNTVIVYEDILGKDSQLLVKSQELIDQMVGKDGTTIYFQKIPGAPNK